MVGGHATSFRAAELSEDCADTDIVNLRGIEVGELLDCSFQDLLGWSDSIDKRIRKDLQHRAIRGHMHRAALPSSPLSLEFAMQKE